MDNLVKPKVTLVGQDGNVFNLLGICARALKKVGMNDKAKEMQTKVFACASYDEALCIMLEYVDAN